MFSVKKKKVGIEETNTMDCDFSMFLQKCKELWAN